MFSPFIQFLLLLVLGCATNCIKPATAFVVTSSSRTSTSSTRGVVLHAAAKKEKKEDAKYQLIPEPEGGEELTSIKTMADSRMKKMGKATGLTGVRTGGEDDEDGTIYQFWLTAKVEGALVKETHTIVLKDSAKKADFPGFRKGQVPPYAMPQIRSFAVQEGIITTCKSVLEAYGLQAAKGSDGDVEVLEDIQNKLVKIYKVGDDFHFTATVNAMYDPALLVAEKKQEEADGVIDVEATTTTATDTTSASSSDKGDLNPPIKKEWGTPLTVGDTVPSVTFKTRVRIDSDDPNPFDWKDVSSDELFKGKRVVMFGLPGAFTPLCSSTMVPGYDEARAELLDFGIDEVYCVSVNDAFVMRQWGLNQGLEEDKTFGANGFKNLKLLPDGAAQFTRGMGMSTVWSSNRGFGERSWRYSCVINDMKIENLNLEGELVQNAEPDPFEYSDVGTIIKYLKSVKKD
mmetsp:Transcript_6902/g.7776  ORF Transcript_6902/g.7776 Transcript_6902/m.7776 type:complete len:458 (-) Transcript_6902:12-1385(-)